MSEETRKILKKLEVGTTYSGVDVICRQYKEIKRLNNIINDMDKQIDNLCNNQKREVERLNNIINELEYESRYKRIFNELYRRYELVWRN